MRIIILLCLLNCSFMAISQLRVSENQRYLVEADGKPFFWLGDTAWELFHRLDREDAEVYLKNRADKSFNVVQAVVLAELDGLNTPNAYRNKPLFNNDPTQLNEAYFQHVDYIIDKAASLGIYIGLLPTWGDKVFKEKWGKGPEIFNTSNAKVFGELLGERYKDRKNIIWILGGDRNPRPDTEDVEIWRAMAAGVVEGVGGQDKALMTFHPQPTDVQDGGSAKWFHQDNWLDFNMFQTGHCRENNVWERIQVTYNKIPVKPVLDGETIYEDHPVCFNAKDLGTSSAYDVRKHAYLSVFAGSFGHTYGCHDIWQMYAPNHEPVNGPHLYWYDALDLQGASQMQYLKKLMTSRSMLERVPDQSIIIDPLYEHNRIQATRGTDYLFVYSSQGKPFTMNMKKISGKLLQVAWYNPRNGETTDAGTIENKGKKLFTPPSSGYGQDWVLILDDASKPK